MVMLHRTTALILVLDMKATAQLMMRQETDEQRREAWAGIYRALSALADAYAAK
jgi:hypothetical protein